MQPLDVLPLIAAVLAAPQFVPQIARLRRTGDAAGLSAEWSALTSINNAAWVVYFSSVGYWTAVVPTALVALTSGALTVLLTSRRGATPRFGLAIVAWLALMATVSVLGGTAGLRAVLTVAFAVQVTPSLWAALTHPHPTGLAVGTWRLIAGETACWLVFGIASGELALVVLGVTGVASSVVMLLRARQVAPLPGQELPWVHATDVSGRDRAVPREDQRLPRRVPTE